LDPSAQLLPENLSEADWTKAGRALARNEGSISWWLGDWWAYGHTYGERKALVESEHWEGPTFQACMNAACVCRSFETSRRREVLSFNHHREVLPIEDPYVQDRFLDWCEEGVSLNGGKPRSTRELRRAVRAYLDEQGWSEDERYRRERAKAGITVVATLRGDDDKHLLNWAQFNGLLVRVDRNSEWGNPFEIPDDGDRDTVCSHYALHYLPHKPSLLNKIYSLKGKVLACWCYPERCHGDYLAECANNTGPEQEPLHDLLATRALALADIFSKLVETVQPHDGWQGLKDCERSALLAKLKVIGRTEQRYEKFHRSPGIPQNSFPPHF
jgi:hypothetical protein